MSGYKDTHQEAYIEAIEEGSDEIEASEIADQAVTDNATNYYDCVDMYDGSENEE